MNDLDRGKIHYRDRARQIIDFSGLRYGNITPTDIDGLIEYQNKAVIFLEYKLDGYDEMPYGQRLAFERIANDLKEARKECVVFLCVHTVEDCEKDIDGKNSTVKEIYWHGRWHSKREEPITVGEQIDKYIEWLNKNGQQK